VEALAVLAGALAVGEIAKAPCRTAAVTEIAGALAAGEAAMETAGVAMVIAVAAILANAARWVLVRVVLPDLAVLEARTAAHDAKVDSTRVPQSVAGKDEQV